MSMWRSIPSPAVQRRAETNHVTTVQTQGSIRPSIQRNPQTLCTRHSAQGPLTWFSPPVETVARAVAAEQSPATWSHSWALLSGHTPGNRLDRRAEPGEGIRACTCTRGTVVCAGRMDLRVDIVETRLCLDHLRRPPAYSPSSPTPTFRRRSRQTGRVSPLTLAAWNVRSLLDNPRSNRPERRTALVARELARYKVDIAALSETRFSEQGQLEEVLSAATQTTERRSYATFNASSWPTGILANS
nr:unnamed protein product [Spirometra erinaceieuropaei]